MSTNEWLIALDDFIKSAILRVNSCFRFCDNFESSNGLLNQLANLVSDFSQKTIFFAVCDISACHWISKFKRTQNVKQYMCMPLNSISKFNMT